MAKTVQTLIGWIALSVVLLSALAAGGNIEAAWLALTAATTVLFAVQLLVDRAAPHRMAVFAPLAVPAVLFLGALIWAGLQISPFLPAAWSASAWDFVDADGMVAINPSGALLIIARLAAYGMIFWLAARASWDEGSARAFMVAIGAWCAMCAVYALVSAQVGTNVITGVAHTIVTGPFVNPNHFATYCAIGLITIIAAVIVKLEDLGRGRRARQLAEGFVNGLWLYVLLGLVLVTATALTLSRGGILAALVGLGAFALSVRQGSFGQRFAGAALLMIVFVAFAFLTGLGRILPELVSDAGVAGGAGRQTIYAVTLSAIIDRPWLGVGLAGFEDGIKAYLTPDLAQMGTIDLAHNSYLENAMEFGVAAAGAFYLALAIILVQVWQGTYRRRRMRALPAAGFAIGCLVAFHALVDFSAQMPALAALFAFVLGIAWTQSIPLEERQTQRSPRKTPMDGRRAMGAPTGQRTARPRPQATPS